MFNQQHHKVISQAIKESSQGTNLIDEERLVSLLAYYFSLDNSQFNREKFKEACK